MRAPDDLPEDLEGDYRAGEIRDTRTAAECVERDLPDDLDRVRYDDYASLWDDLEDLTGWDITEEGEPCQPD
jgi:hypothetical protein